MKAHQAKILVDRRNGDIWLTDQRPGQKPKRVKNITNDIFAALASDLVREEGDNVIESTRSVQFSDGTSIEVTVKLNQGGANAEV